MKILTALIKREYWEHRGGMLITPVAIAGFLVVLAFILVFTLDNVVTDDNGVRFSLISHIIETASKLKYLNEVQAELAVKSMLYSPVVFFVFVMFIVSFFFALGTLYEERKDRSILFWKSLPVSDTMTVFSKYLAIVIATPIIYAAVVICFQLFALIMGTILAWFGGDSGVGFWTSANLFAVALNTVISILVWTIWFSPLWAWLMLASSWAKRVAFLWGTLPILFIVVAEWTIFNSFKFITMVGEYLFEGLLYGVANMKVIEDGGLDFIEASSSLEAFISLEFWVGMIISAGLLGSAIYLR
ncbi:MAG: nucleoporin NDC1, partial [Kangiellaceae bacterium]|nr:nucleoporin NDC1 [Kangiellaceae bacterium]